MSNKIIYYSSVRDTHDNVQESIVEERKQQWEKFYGEMQAQHLAFMNGGKPIRKQKPILSAQGFNVNHNIRWKAGDNVINGIRGFFQTKEDQETFSESYHSCENQGFNFSSLIPGETTINVFLISVILIYIHRRDKVSRNLLIVGLGFVICGHVFSTSVEKRNLPKFMDLWSYIKKDEEKVQMEEMPKAQGFELGIDAFSDVLLITMSIVSGTQVKRTFLDGIIQATKISETQTKNVGFLITSVIRSLHDFLKSIKLENVAKYFVVDALSDDRAIKYQEKVLSFTASFNSGNPESMIYCSDVAKSLMAEAKELSLSLDKKSYDYKLVMDSSTKLIAINQRIADMKVSTNGERVEPVGVLLKGGPATMKGILAKRIAKVLAMATIPEEWKPSYKEDSRGFFFSVPKDKFWDTYSNKAWITFYDDVFQRRDAVADSEADALKIIDMVNSAPFPLPMAKIEQKNDVFFRSAFLIATTNLTKWDNLNSVTDVNAVQRRFHIEVDITINKKYLNEDESLNSDKLPRSDIADSSAIPNDFWQLKVVEKNGDKVSTSRNLSIKELIALCVERQKKHVTNFHINRRSEDLLVDSLAAELGYDEPWGSFCEEEEFDWNLPKSQSDIPGGYENPQFAIERYFDDLDPLILCEYTNDFWAMTLRLKHLELYDGFYRKTIRKLMKTPIDVDRMNRCKHNMKEFHRIIENYFKDCFALQVDPFTRRILTQPHMAVNPVSTFGEIVDKCLVWLENNFVLILVGSVLSSAAISFLVGFFSTVVDENIDVQSQSVDTSRMGKRIVGPTKLIELKVQPQQKLMSQGKLPVTFEFDKLPKFTSLDFGERNNKNDVLAKIFNKYFYIAYIASKQKNGEVDLIRLGHLTNVVGQLFLMPMHFVLLLETYRKRDNYDGSSIILVTSNGNNHITVSLEEFIEGFKSTEEAAARDICLVKINAAQRMSKGCLSNILKRSDVKNLRRTTSFSGTVVGSYHPTPGLAAMSLRNHYTQMAFNKGGSPIEASWTEESSYYMLFDTITYRLSCAAGDCGSLVVANDSNYENRIISGIHVAGGKDMGHATGFDQEMIEEAIKTCFPYEKYFTDEEIPEFLLEIPVSQGNLKPIYNLKPGYVPGELFKSEITKSKFFRKLPEPYNVVNTMPAKLKPFYDRDGTLIDPLLKAFNKYGKIAPEISSEQVSQAFESYTNLILTADNSLRSARRIIELKEALHSFDNINSISSSTSSGYPMSLNKDTDYKKIYYKALQEGDQIKAESAYLRIANLVNSALEAIRNGIRLFYAYKQCGKDETREWFKVLEGKTRLFSACPFILLVLFRMYFGSFISMYVRCNFHVGSAVGVNPYSTQWDDIARSLLKFSENDNDICVAAGDQGQFDTRQWSIIHNGILDMINDWYGGTPEESFIRQALFMEITNSRHIFRGQVYEWTSGLPSGNPMTAIINTIYNNIIFRMSWGISGLDIRNFNDNVYLIVLGDDNAFTVSKKYRYLFNEETLPEYMAEIGNEYTTEIKGSATAPFRPITEIEFLKRSFYKDQVLNRWIAPLREEAIAEMLNWTKKGKEGSQISLDNVVFAMREFSLHGYAKFEHWKKHLLDLCNEQFPNMKPHGDFPLDFNNTYKSVLDLEYYF